MSSLKQHLHSLLQGALEDLTASGELELDALPEIPLERSRGGDHGDYASPVALALARVARRKPRDIAELIVSCLAPSEQIDRVEVAGAGFINFFLAEGAYQALLETILTAGDGFGRSTSAGSRRMQVEFVSVNPTGPLHVGHGRHASYGAAIANLLAAVGWNVQREYYINDAGRQMNILAVSVWLRYLEHCGERVPFPANGYKGSYVHDMGRELLALRGDIYAKPAAEVVDGLPADAADGGDKDVYVDVLIARARALLGDSVYREIFQFVRDDQVEEIREDLSEFGVQFDHWYSEQSLVDGDAIHRAVERLRAAGHVFERDGATWFRSSEFGDEKDRVVVRENGVSTYFASDIAYHMEKFERGFERVIDVWGADHHGYVARVKGALAALGVNPDRFEVPLVQFVHLYRGGEKVQMSTRGGEFVTLRELREEVGGDAARFFYVLRRCDQHLDFDLDLAKSKSSDNPVYYIQYAHARICSVLREAETRDMAFDSKAGDRGLERLTQSHEIAVLRSLSRFPEIIESAAADLEPHQLAYYLRELANDLHTYYNAHTFLVDDSELRQARLALVAATRQVLASGLELLGVSAPEQM